MAKQFDFLAQAKPASLYRLMERLPFEDAAIVLTGLPHGIAIQVMAYFPEDRQGELLSAMREARRVEPERAAQTAGRIREMLKAAKTAREAQPGHPFEQPKPRPEAPPPAVPPRRVAQQNAAYQATPPKSPPTPSPEVGGGNRREPVRPSRPAKPAGGDKPTPWIPRTATASPINGPALPGKPPPVSGDPLRSPLAKAGLLDLIGRAQEKLLPKKATAPVRPPAAPTRPPAGAGKRPEPREGVVPSRAVEMNRTPRVIGPRPKAADTAGDPPVAGGARRMDGKAILAAILREAGPEIRGNVRHDDPSLFRELRGRMFFFDDLIYTEDGALAQVFTAAPAEESALALKFAAPALRDRVLRVVSPGRARALRDARGGRAGMDDIESAQQKVLQVALRLQAAGRILIDPRDPDLAGN